MKKTCKPTDHEILRTRFGHLVLHDYRDGATVVFCTNCLFQYPPKATDRPQPCPECGKRLGAATVTEELRDLCRQERHAESVRMGSVLPEPVRIAVEQQIGALKDPVLRVLRALAEAEPNGERYVGELHTEIVIALAVVAKAALEHAKPAENRIITLN